MNYEIISQGAEAIIYKVDENTLKKVRVSKGYRVKEIDDELIKSRTRHEIKAIKRANINVPKIFNIGEDFIDMEFIKGIVFKDAFSLEYCEIIGEMVANLHDSNIIHGDLTTSNMILNEDKEIYFIDFGLSFFSKRLEDRAVDLHLLYRALESKHYNDLEKAFELVLKGYKKSSVASDVIDRFKIVEKRGRNKH